MAVNNSLQRGYCLGDVLGIIKTAKVMIENERPEHILLSLHDDDPLNFLWERFVRENLVTVIHDRWDKASKHQQYEIFGQRRASRTVKGISFDIYKELYPRLDGGDRQHILCGKERGLGRRNIFEYYYYGQESFIEYPTGTTTFGDDVIDVPDVQQLTSRSVFLAPHEKCQGNRIFTLPFWQSVTRKLLHAGFIVIVNDQGTFFPECHHSDLIRTFKCFPKLIRQIAEQQLVVCGNTGIGWVAAATNTPFIALERDMIFSEYSFEKCGCQSLIGAIDTPDPNLVTQRIIAYFEQTDSSRTCNAA